MEAAENGNLSICNILVDAGANKTLTDKNGRSAYHYALLKHPKKIDIQNYLA